MKKIIYTIISIFIIFNVYCNEILDELNGKLNQYKYFPIYKGDKDYYLENKLYLIPKIYNMGVSIEIIDNILRIDTASTFFIDIIKYKILKINNNDYIIEGIDYYASKTYDKIKFEFIFDKTILTVIKNDDKENSKLFYIDINNDFEERYETQRKDYLYSLIKDSKKNELKITKDNKIEYNGGTYDYYKIESICMESGGFYKDKFVLIFGNDEIPIEIIKNTLKIIKDKKIKVSGEFYFLE